ncbi:uncharacterized protein LOC115752479 [Rhodamnia argentea]|uniref:Uncharacterized protein LOC115752479 n=1 Tax=Rhodamnia argentea TaxID=178133 RepID=A0A8B8QJ37_9MYRT|nr:uncharacterized protein LOC115752479 [Rhodamnia argentea]
MDFDIKNNAQYPLYRTISSTSSSAPQSPMYRHSVYPKVAAQPHASATHPSPYHQTAHPPSTSSSAGLGVRVAILPEYRIPPPNVSDSPYSPVFLHKLEREVKAASSLTLTLREKFELRQRKKARTGAGLPWKIFHHEPPSQLNQVVVAIQLLVNTLHPGLVLKLFLWQLQITGTLL